MANYDDMAFNALESDNDAYVTGGAVTVSEYEQNMTPTDQKSYEDTLMRSFQTSYAGDPHKGNLDFTHWLKTLNFDLIRERAAKWEDERANVKSWSIGEVWEGMPEQAIRWVPEHSVDDKQMAILEDAGILQKLAHLHTGRVEDIVEIVKSIAPESQPQMQQAQFRQPQSGSSGQY